MPLFRTEPEEDGLLVYKHYTPPEWSPDIFWARVQTFEGGSQAERTTIQRELP